MVGLKENKGGNWQCREKRKREGDVFYSSMMPALLSMLASIDFRYTTIATKVSDNEADAAAATAKKMEASQFMVTNTCQINDDVEKDRILLLEAFES